MMIIHTSRVLEWFTYAKSRVVTESPGLGGIRKILVSHALRPSLDCPAVSRLE